MWAFLLYLMPICQPKVRVLKELKNHIALFIGNALDQKTKHIEMLNGGWFPSTFTLRCKQKHDESMDDFMFRCIRVEYFDEAKKYLTDLHVSRKRHIEEAFSLCEEGRYLGAIPLLLLILDGLPLDRGFGLIFNGKSNNSGNHSLAVLRFFEALQKYFTQNSGIGDFILIKYYEDFIRESFNFKISKSTASQDECNNDFVLNRHGVLHGMTEYLDYDDEKNALKIISFMLFVSSILHMVDIERERRK